MNTKDLITTIRGRNGQSAEDAEAMFGDLVEILHDEFVEGNSVAISGFGSFEIKKKNERISVNPSTQERMLVPPKLVLSFKPSPALKSKFSDFDL